jgi:hypothetical protein
MPYLESLRRFLYNRKLNSFQQTNLHAMQEGHFKRIKQVGIVFDATDLHNREVAMSLAANLRDVGKRPRLLGYFKQDLDGLSFPFDYFTVKDLSFSYIPKSPKAQAFINEPFDLLISLDLEMIRPILYVCAASKAVFKIGPAQADTKFFDLMIDPKTPGDFDSYIKETRKTLKTFS